MTREIALAHTLVQLADTLVADFDIVELLTMVTDRCVEVLDVDAAGIVLASPEGDLRSMASSSDEVHVLEVFALVVEEGPSLDCYRTGVPVVNQDLGASNGRWPRLAHEALAAGYHSVHALPLRLRGTVIGALNLLRREPGEIAAADIGAAQAFADIATIAILQHRAASDAVVVNQQLSQALNTRIVIEQAKGMIVQRGAVSMEDAFNRLRRYALAQDRRLAEVAIDVIERRLSTEALDPTV
jgi:GAF domain-containing protein